MINSRIQNVEKFLTRCDDDDDYIEEDDYIDEEDEVEGRRRKATADENGEVLIKSTGRQNVYEWVEDTKSSLEIVTYVIQKYIQKIADELLVIDERRYFEFEYEHGKKENVLAIGYLIFTHNGVIYFYEVDTKDGFNRILSSKNIDGMVENINHEIKYNNPLRCKNLHLRQGRGIRHLIKQKPSVSLDELILPDKLKEDLYDNTIFQLEHIGGANGVILHGQPGVGKSHACQAIITEAIKKGFSTCYTTTELDYSMLGDFIEKFLAPCIIIFEDIDTFAVDREDIGINSGISDFLQFMSGISEMNDRIVFIATTNYLDHIDKAVTNRPMRFNRKFGFKLPTDSEIDRLISLYFGDCKITEEQRKLCYGKSFTGSHFKEIQRTSELLSKKRELTVEEVFSDAVELVHDNFSPSLDEINSRIL